MEKQTDTMEQQYITSFSIIGISVRTTNEGGQMGLTSRHSGENLWLTS